jgi:protein subunit release factor A
MTNDAITVGWETSHSKGGQHTNGPDHGVVTIEHAAAGIKVSIQTGPHLRPSKARDLATLLVDMAISELVRGGHS